MFGNQIKATYKEDEVLNNIFKQSVIDFFEADPDLEDCGKDLDKIFKKLPSPKFKLEKDFVPNVSPARATPLAALQRPLSRISTSVSRPKTPKATANKSMSRFATPKADEFSRRKTTIVSSTPISVASTPKINVSKMKTSIRAAPHGAPKKIRKSAPRLKKIPEIETIEPFIYRCGDQIPEQLIERDILYVASQLAGYQDEDLPLSKDVLVEFVLNTAKKFKILALTKKKALDAIGHVFWRLKCVRKEFWNIFTYNPTNPFFAELQMDNGHANLLARAQTLLDGGINKCDGNQAADESLIRELNEPAAVEEGFNLLKTYGDESDILASELYSATVSTRKKPKSKSSDVELLGETLIKVIGFEMSNAENGALSEVLALPEIIKGVMRQGLGVRQDKLLRMLKDGIPRCNVATRTIQGEFEELDGRIKQQLGEHDHNSKSQIINKHLKYYLQPNALERQTFWQARGADMPNWFPGYFTVFRDSHNLKPTLQSSPSSAFLHAWQTMAPVVAM
jgi:hypothetical protein